VVLLSGTTFVAEANVFMSAYNVLAFDASLACGFKGVVTR